MNFQKCRCCPPVQLAYLILNSNIFPSILLSHFCYPTFYIGYLYVPNICMLMFPYIYRKVDIKPNKKK